MIEWNKNNNKYTEKTYRYYKNKYIISNILSISFFFLAVALISSAKKNCFAGTEMIAVRENTISIGKPWRTKGNGVC